MNFIKYKFSDTYKYGETYFADLNFEYQHKRIYRRIRVFLPENYNQEERYPVLYMLDGQNLFGDNDCQFSSWYIEKEMHKWISSGHKGFIVVGIDSPKSALREDELCPYKVNKKINDGMNHPYGEVLGEFIAYKVKKVIDESFSTLKDRKNTAIGGSSMGGLMAFYIKNYYPQIFSYSLCFSPAFFLYTRNRLNKTYLGERERKDQGCYFFYVGGTGFEKDFVDDTIYVYQEMVKRDNITARLFIKSDAEHNEEAWEKVFLISIKDWLEK